MTARALPANAHRHRDRGGARVRHRPSRHHARLPARARRARASARASAPHPRSRHRHRRAGDRRGEAPSAAACWRPTSTPPPCAPRAPMPGSTAPARWSTVVDADGVAARSVSARARRSISSSPISCSGRCSAWPRRCDADRARRARRAVRPAAGAGQRGARRLSRACALERRIDLDGWTTLVLVRRASRRRAVARRRPRS